MIKLHFDIYNAGIANVTITRASGRLRHKSDQYREQAQLWEEVTIRRDRIGTITVDQQITPDQVPAPEGDKYVALRLADLRITGHSEIDSTAELVVPLPEQVSFNTENRWRARSEFVSFHKERLEHDE